MGGKKEKREESGREVKGEPASSGVGGVTPPPASTSRNNASPPKFLPDKKLELNSVLAKPRETAKPFSPAGIVEAPPFPLPHAEVAHYSPRTLPHTDQMDMPLREFLDMPLGELLKVLDEQIRIVKEKERAAESSPPEKRSEPTGGRAGSSKDPDMPSVI